MEPVGVAWEEEAELQLIRDEIKAAKLKLQLIKDNTKIVKGKVVALEHDISPLSKGHADDGSGSKEAKKVTRLVGEEIKVESGETSHIVSWTLPLGDSKMKAMAKDRDTQSVVVGQDHTILILLDWWLLSLYASSPDNKIWLQGSHPGCTETFLKSQILWVTLENPKLHTKM